MDRETVETRELREIDNIYVQTEILRSILGSNLNRYYYVPDKTKPKEGYYVEVPNEIQIHYKCRRCDAIAISKIYKPDFTAGNVGLTKKCPECNGWDKMRIKTMTVVRDVPMTAAKEDEEAEQVGELERYL